MFSLPQSLFKTVAFALFMLLCPCVAVAEHGFGFEDPLRFNYSAQGPTANTIYFLVFSKEGTISDVAIQLRSARDPDGQTLPPDAVTICIASAQNCVPPDHLQLAEKGVSITLKLNATYFHRIGDYRVLIDFAGTGPDKKKLTAQANLTLNRPAAEINLDQVKDQTIEICRSAPWASVDKDFTISISEASGKTTLDDVKVVGQSVYRKDSRILVPGELSVQLATQDPGNKNAPGVIRVEVVVKNLVHAGAFDTSLVLNSPSLAARQVIPLRLVVSDNVFWPLIVIVLGVAGGFAVNYFSGKWRTRQLNRRAVLRLQNEIGRFRQVTKAAANAAIVEGMWRALRVAEESNDLNDLEAVRATLTQVETDLSEFRKTHAEAKAKTYADLKQLRSEVDLFEQHFKPTLDDERNIHALKERLRDAERLLIGDQVDYAAENLTAITVLFNDLKKSVFTRYFDELQRRFNQLKSKTQPYAQKESQALITEIEELLSASKPDETSEKLTELALALDQLSDTASGARAARGEPIPVAEPMRVRRPEERTAINIITEPAQRSTEAPIQFRIVDPENLFAANDVFRWNFGEAGSQHEDGRQADYQYKEFGDYVVQVEVKRGSVVIKNLNEPLTVLPGARVDQSQRVLARVQRSDLLLSLLALVLAGLTGVLALYVGKAFGTLSDYLLAFLWGFGIDNSVRGFAGVLGKISPGGGGE